MSNCPLCNSSEREQRNQVNIWGCAEPCYHDWHDYVAFDVTEAVEINKEEHIRIVSLEQAVNLHQGRLSSNIGVISTARRFQTYLERGE